MEVRAKSLMSFGGFLDSSSAGGRLVGDCVSFTYNSSSNKEEPSAINMPSGAFAQPRLVSPSPVKSMLNSSGLSLALVRLFISSSH